MKWICSEYYLLYTLFICIYWLCTLKTFCMIGMITIFSNNKALLIILRSTMNKLVAPICLLGILLGGIQGKSSKKGLCIPPGTNFHCGDLSAFDNVRYYLFSIWMNMQSSKHLGGGITGTWSLIMRRLHQKISVPVTLAAVALFPRHTVLRAFWKKWLWPKLKKTDFCIF